MEYNVEVTFSKNVAYPEYGENAYNLESYIIKLSYGKNGNFKTSKDAIFFIKEKITDTVLNKFSSVCVFVMRNGSGKGEYLKSESFKYEGDSLSIDKEYLNKLLT
jgi:hypothetical protein